MYLYLRRASSAVIRFLGSIVNIFLTRSFAEVDIEGHGDDSKSNWPLTISSNMPFSVSDVHVQENRTLDDHRASCGS